MKTNDSMNGDVLYGVARLQEYYGNEAMHRFFHECDEQEGDVIGAFLHFDRELRRCLVEYGSAPDFGRMAGDYARAHGWIFRLDERLERSAVGKLET